MGGGCRRSFLPAASSRQVTLGPGPGTPSGAHLRGPAPLKGGAQDLPQGQWVAECPLQLAPITSMPHGPTVSVHVSCQLSKTICLRGVLEVKQRQIRVSSYVNLGPLSLSVFTYAFPPGCCQPRQSHLPLAPSILWVTSHLCGVLLVALSKPWWGQFPHGRLQTLQMKDCPHRASG